MLCPVCSTENFDNALQCKSCTSDLNLVRASSASPPSAAGSPFDRSHSAAPLHVSGSNLPTFVSDGGAFTSATGTARARVNSSEIPDFGPRYRVDGKLGEGGMGSVYKAYDRELDRFVALKVIRPELMAHHEVLQRFRQEMLLASRISHKHILRIHDIGDAAGGVKFISMAYIQGRNLAELLEQQKVLPVETAVEISKQLCAALHAAHREGVVHRDLKPQNILIDQNNCVYVSDFGLAKSLENEPQAATAMTSVGQVLGTPRYMSPEQVESAAVDERTDIYSFGLILYEMVTGDLPFQGNSLQLMLGKVQSLPRNPSLLNSKLPPYLVGIIMRCLKKDPQFRYATFDDVLADLESQRFTPAGSATERKKSNLRLSAMYAAGAALLLVIIAGSVWGVRHLTLQRSQSPEIASAPTKFLAVLPFRVSKEQSDLDYLSVGLSEALYAKFFGLKDLQIASPTAVQKTNTNDAVAKIGHELGANLVVSGTMQSAGDRLQIIVQLDDVSKGQHLLTQEFSGVKQDLLTLEDQIYSKLVRSIEVKPSGETLSRVSLHQTENYPAYDVYLKGRNTMRGQLDAKNVKAAIQFYEDAIKQDPGFAVAYAGIADADLRMYRITKENDWAERAVSAAQQAQRLNEDLPEVYFALGSAYVATGKTVEAISTLNKAIALAPNSDEGYRRLGDAFRATGNKDDAIKAYNRAIQLNPYYWFNYNALGSAYLKFNDNPKALEAFRRVTELEPDNAAGYQNLSVVYFSMGDFEKCIPVLQKSLELDKHPIAYSNLGTAYFYLKRYDEAVPMFEQAVKLDPASETNLGNLADAYRWAGKTQQANATYENAIQAGFKALAVNSRDAARMGRMAQYYAKKGDTKHAFEFIRRARVIDAKDSSLVYAEAVIDWLAGKQDAAQKLEEALKAGYPLQAVQNDPELAKLQALPQFAQLAKGHSQQSK